MSETEELRGGLREFGVQYQACGDSFTMWKHDGKTATYAEYPEGGKLKAFVTPEQAIAATLGAGTCQMEYVERPTKSTLDAIGVYFCSECGSPTYNDCMPRYCIYCGAEVSA